MVGILYCDATDSATKSVEIVFMPTPRIWSSLSRESYILFGNPSPYKENRCQGLTLALYY